MSTIEMGPQQITNKAELLYKSRPIRQITLDIRDLLERPDITSNKEADISATAEEALTYLRVAYQGIGSVYGREDILKGLGAIDHPSAQLVIAKTFIAEGSLEGSPVVAKKAEKILLDLTRKIYPGTLEELLGHEDSKVKDLGVRIVESNPQNGVLPDGNIVPAVTKALKEMTTPGLTKKGETLIRGATLLSLLYERTGNLPEDLSDVVGFLANDVSVKIYRLRQADTFVKLVHAITSENETAARTIANIQETRRTLLSEIENPEELRALIRLLPAGSLRHKDTVEQYKSLVALMKERVRENLATRVAQIKAQEEARQKQLQAQTEETNRQRQLKLYSDQERQAQIRREEREVQLALVQKAHQWFPHL